MDKRFTYYARTIACTALTLSILVTSSFLAKTYAQNNCTSSRIVFSEDFGTGVGPVSNPDILGLTYQATGPLANEGTYRIINDAQQKPEWHASEDGTSNNINGRMLVTNAIAGDFYSRRIDRLTGFESGDFAASLFVMNVNTPGTCAPSPLLPVITIKVEYLSQANVWIPLTGSPYTASPVGQSIDPVWAGIGSTFNLPSTGTFLVKSLRMVIADETPGGCGNDFAADGITLSQCTAGNTVPVELTNVSARQKGSGVSVEWSTSQEINSKSFIVEKSLDGNTNWSIVATVNGAGNSSTVKNYNAFDARPVKGVNFYRLMQTDIDGNFKYSKTVSVRLNITKTGVTVIENPFRNSLTVDFSSTTSQSLSVRLADMTGKQVAVEKWTVNTGNTRKEFTNISRLQQGMYVLTISNAAGEILYNNKVIKQ